MSGANTELVMGCVHGSDKSKKILLLGLDCAGKTTILWSLKLKESIDTNRLTPTIGYNVELDRELNMTLWDVAGQNQVRQHWRYFLAATDGIIFVVDSANKDRWSTAKSELMRVLGNCDVEHIYTNSYIPYLIGDWMT